MTSTRTTKTRIGGSMCCFGRPERGYIQVRTGSRADREDNHRPWRSTWSRSRHTATASVRSPPSPGAAPNHGPGTATRAAVTVRRPPATTAGAAAAAVASFPRPQYLRQPPPPPPRSRTRLRTRGPRPAHIALVARRLQVRTTRATSASPSCPHLSTPRLQPRHLHPLHQLRSQGPHPACAGAADQSSYRSPSSIPTTCARASLPVASVGAATSGAGRSRSAGCLERWAPPSWGRSRRPLQSRSCRTDTASSEHGRQARFRRRLRPRRGGDGGDERVRAGRSTCAILTLPRQDEACRERAGRSRHLARRYNSPPEWTRVASRATGSASARAAAGDASPGRARA